MNFLVLPLTVYKKFDYLVHEVQDWILKYRTLGNSNNPIFLWVFLTFFLWNFRNSDTHEQGRTRSMAHVVSQL